MADPNTRQGKRTPVTLKIKFKSETLEQFIERYAVDVSQGGIFIRTKEPLAVGTQMKFEFQLRDASPLIAGEGTVVWTRENDPSRPAIAPGMGVRFDRLADGSQTVLERILAEKAKQAPSRSQGETAPGQNKQMFAEVPTRVAPAPVQEALGLRSRTDSEQTPLPKPMPFHSDADDFDEKAFEEATKVRSLDDLAAESARDGEDEDDGSGLSDNPKNATVVMPADELLARRRVTAEGIAIPDEPKRDSAERAAVKSVPDRESAPGLPSPPVVEGPRAARVDSTPPPRSEPSTPPPMSADSSGSTKLGMEPAKATTAAAASSDAAPRAVAAEPSRPVAPARPSSAPIIIGIILAVAASVGLVWFFVLREDGSGEVADTTTPGSAATPGSNQVTPPEPGSGSAVATTEPGSAGSAITEPGSAGSAAAMPPAGPTVDTVIASAAKGATVEITGTDQKGPAPFTAKLEKDKTYTAIVTAPGYLPTEVEVKGGVKTTAKPELKPRVLSVTTDPAGADIYIDNYNTQKITPSEVQLTAAQAARPRVRVSLRRPGYRPVDKIVEKSAFKDEEKRATHSLEVKLTQQAVVRPRPDAGSTGTGTGTGTSTGTGTDAGSGAGGGATGGGSTTPDPNAGSAAPPPTPPAPAPTPKPTPAPTPAPSTGSAAPSGGQILK